jgi:hypothetical protein
MKSTELAALVRDMRKAQKEYFKATYGTIEKSRWLDESKRLEKAVDEAVKNILDPKLF